MLRQNVQHLSTFNTYCNAAMEGPIGGDQSGGRYFETPSSLIFFIKEDEPPITKHD